jgi:hypothetical protein
MKRKSFLVICLLFLSLFTVLFIEDQATFACVKSDPAILTAFVDLRGYISNLPDKTLGRVSRISLIRKLDNAKKAYQHGLTCTGVNVLDAFLNECQALRKWKKPPVAESLYNSGRALCDMLLATLSNGRTCHHHERFGTKPVVDLKESDNKHLVASMSFGEPKLLSVEEEGELYTQILLPGVESRSGESGFPGVPVVSRLVAIPRGAEISILTKNPSVAETVQLNLLPFQPSPPDTEDESDPFFDINYNPPFTKNQEAYDSNGQFPPNVCAIMQVGNFRDLPIGLVSCAAGQYNPKNATLIFFKSVDFELRFSGGSEAFVTDASQNPFESQTADLSKVVLNKDAVFEYVEHRQAELPCSGEELLIITHKDFRPAADKLAKWKNDKGILTNVFEVDSSTTAEQIDDFIDQRYDQCIVRPSYVLLIGDAEYIPTFYTFTVTSRESATDFPYSNHPASNHPTPDLIPDFGVGRIPVDTFSQADDVVEKIIKYEKSPPLTSDFYKNISLSAMFQCCGLSPIPPGTDEEAYIQTCEFLRNGLLDKGYNVERIYTEETCTKYTNPFDDYTPKYYYNGTSLPQDLDQFSGFTWSGSTQDIIDAFNSGRFLILHRDHGAEQGWVYPLFSKKYLNQLSNGDLLPVAFSINCSSGFFDNETNPGEPLPKARQISGRYYPSTNPTYGGKPDIKDETYFSEEILRKADGGVVGLIAPSRDSTDTGDDAMTRGLFDALWPDTDSSFGGTTSKHRLGDILNHAKLYVISQIGVPQMLGDLHLLDMSTALVLFHVLGDPTLEIWTSKPVSLSSKYKITNLTDSLHIEYDIDGATITALQKTEKGLAPIGRATVKDGKATLEYVVQPEPDLPILLSASLDNAVSLLLTASQPVDLSDDSSFGELATRISFDPPEGRTLFEYISNQYEALGVLFTDDETTTPIIVDDTTRGGTTHSEPYSLINYSDPISGDPDAISPGSAGVPLTITFTEPVQRVGMYIGNGVGGDVLSKASLTAYNQYGEYIFKVERFFGNNVTTFIGLDAGAPSINQVQLDYGDNNASEEIDDLIFE